MKESQSTSRNKQRGSFSIKTLICLVIIGAIIPIAYIGWKTISAPILKIIEKEDPVLILPELPKGIGKTPVSITFYLQDEISGLDEVVVRAIQRNSSKEIFRQKLDGKHKAKIKIDFAGDKSEIEEGLVDIQIKAFDKSFWSNGVETTIPLKVDYRKPTLEVISSQHNVVQGGSQLVFYKVSDESLAISGVKVGRATYLGFPAKGIDEAFTDQSLYVAIYAIPQTGNVSEIKPKVFAEDEVGNATSISFFNRIRKANRKFLQVNVTDDFIRNDITRLLRDNLKKILQFSNESGVKFQFETPKGSEERLIEQFNIINHNLRHISDNELLSVIQPSRLEKLWDKTFVKQPGPLRSLFGENTSFYYKNKKFDSLLQKGYTTSVGRSGGEVIAANDGIVLFVGDLGTYGNAVVIDHGLGLVSIYGSLQSAQVNKGDLVYGGQQIGLAGNSGFAANRQIYFEMRVHGTPVDAREWWDSRWIYGHVIGKINEVKKVLGIPIYQPLN